MRRRSVVLRPAAAYVGSLLLLAAIAPLVGALYVSHAHDLVCARTRDGVRCRYVGHYLTSVRDDGEVWRLSAHDVQLSDEEKGPKLLVEREHELPIWIAHPDADAIVSRLLGVSEDPEGAERRVPLPEGRIDLVLVLTGALLLAYGAALTRFATILTADDDGDRLVVAKRAIGTSPERALGLDQIGRPRVERVEDTIADRLVFGPGDDPITLALPKGAAEKGKAFLESEKKRWEARKKPAEQAREAPAEEAEDEEA